MNIKYLFGPTFIFQETVVDKKATKFLAGARRLLSTEGTFQAMALLAAPQFQHVVVFCLMIIFLKSDTRKICYGRRKNHPR
jgi:hypothetical protein